MDDDYLSSLNYIFLLGSFTAFLSALFSYFSQQKLNEELDNNVSAALRISKLRNYIDENVNALFSLELVIYFVSFFWYLYNIESIQTLKPNSILIFLVLILVSRIILFAIGMRFANELTLKFSYLILIFCKLSYIFHLPSELLNNLLGGKETPEEAKDEITAFVETAHEEGSIDEDEYRILTNIMKFSDVLVEDIMTPRTVVFSCPADLTVEEAVGKPELKNYSRFPVWEGEGIDDGLKGYVLTRDVLHAAISGSKDLKMRDLAKDIFMLEEESRLDDALEEFLKRKQHMFAVVDEYGGFEGIITMEDVVETMLGVEIVDEADHVIDLREMAKRRRDRRIFSKDDN